MRLASCLHDSVPGVRVLTVILAVLLGSCVFLAPSTVSRRSQPPFRLIFIKTHKTASTTLAAILRRAGAARDMRFFNPPDHRNVESFRGVLDPPYDAIVNHARDGLWLETIVPGAFKISIVRDPVARFVSAWRYFGYEAAFGQLGSFLERCANGSCQHLQVRGKPVFNAMAWRMGAPIGYNHRAKLEIIDRIREPSTTFPLRGFALVLITERFDEGLLLHFNLSEVTYLSLKADEARETSLLLQSLTTLQKDIISRLNNLDVAIYQAASRRFAALRQSVAGTDFEMELAVFRSLQSELARNCNSLVEATSTVYEAYFRAAESPVRSASPWFERTHGSLGAARTGAYSARSGLAV